MWVALGYVGMIVAGIAIVGLLGGVLLVWIADVRDVQYRRALAERDGVDPAIMDLERAYWSASARRVA